ncbi:hypothetical protein ABT063_49415 [Streptomyces sp. NPDC002838]|uniref:hypothetical protein n=1 Tax=Streptomyces sp. NPDC002838 TaxID=3154436 RepID=UPI00332780EB
MERSRSVGRLHAVLLKELRSTNKRDWSWAVIDSSNPYGSVRTGGFDATDFARRVDAAGGDVTAPCTSGS